MKAANLAGSLYSTLQPDYMKSLELVADRPKLQFRFTCLSSGSSYLSEHQENPISDVVKLSVIISQASEDPCDSTHKIMGITEKCMFFIQ